MLDPRFLAEAGGVNDKDRQEWQRRADELEKYKEELAAKRLDAKAMAYVLPTGEQVMRSQMYGAATEQERQETPKTYRRTTYVHEEPVHDFDR